MEFKDRLKQYRQDNNLTQDELADKLYVSRQAVSKYETGRGYPSIDVMTELAKLMGVSVDELITKGELAKETISAKQSLRKNRATIIALAICVVCVVALSCVSLFYSLKTSPHSAFWFYPYVFCGVVGTSDGNPTEEDLFNDRLFGYCYLQNDDNTQSGKSYNLSYLNSSIGKKSNHFDMQVTMLSNRTNSALFEVYYNQEEQEYVFIWNCNVDLLKSKSVDITLNNGYGDFSWSFSFEFKLVDDLVNTTLYEYDNGGNLLKQTEYNGQKDYTISSKCLYVVVEEKLVDVNGTIYYNRTMITNDEIDNVYFYTLKTVNTNGYCTDFLELYKY